MYKNKISKQKVKCRNILLKINSYFLVYMFKLIFMCIKNIKERHTK